MANLKEIRDRDGKLISYYIRVHRGRDQSGKEIKPWTTTFKVSPTWTEKSARKKAEAAAAVFERQCREGMVGDNRQRFDAYCDYVIELKAARGRKKKTVEDYKDIAQRVCEELGHLRVADIRPDHLNAFYTKLEQGGRRDRDLAIAAADLKAVLKAAKLSQAKLSKEIGIPVRTIGSALAGNPVNIPAAEAIAKGLGLKYAKAFRQVDGGHLAPSTVLKYHRFISSILAQALKEGLVPFNAAERAEAPQQKKTAPRTLQPEQVRAIQEALETEHIKWQVLVHLLIITGARRGEIIGLKWDAVDWEHSRIHIHNTIQCTKEHGVYEETPKTERSVRWISLPRETMKLLRWYETWWRAEKLRLGPLFYDQGFLFPRYDGEPMRPDAVTAWLDDFSKRHGLPHINPHAFRHTMASMLYYSGMDSVSISARLGHAQVSTTADIYAAIIEGADIKSAENLADIFLRKQG